MYCDGWLERQLNADWNSLNHRSEKPKWTERDTKNVWKFPHGTPLRSKTWREKARQIGKRIRNTPALFHFGSLDNLFTIHLARLSLMLADHFYSSQPAYSEWQDEAVQTWANSNPEPNQKLDEHNVGVAHHALLMGRSLPTLPSPDNFCIHYCVYHSQHPLAVRAAIEKRLDCAFTRHEPEQIWQLPEVKQALTSSEQHHLFVVLGTSVLEVGRDFDADWGIIEPSSMRSLIQFAGRIQRHRQIAPESENLVILDRNVRALRGEKVAYCRPGFETGQYPLPHHDLHELIDKEGYRTLNAIPRIAEGIPGNALAALEHARLRAALLDGVDKSDAVAALWWRRPLTWNGELQKRTPFRQASPQASFFLRLEEEGDEPEFCLMQENGVLKPAGRFCKQPLSMANGVEPWIAIDYAEVLQALADMKQLELAAVSRRYGEITLRVSREEETEQWLYHPVLGVFREYL